MWTRLIQKGLWSHPPNALVYCRAREVLVMTGQGRSLTPAECHQVSEEARGQGVQQTQSLCYLCIATVLLRALLYAKICRLTE